LCMGENSDGQEPTSQRLPRTSDITGVYNHVLTVSIVCDSGSRACQLSARRSERSTLRKR